MAQKTAAAQRARAASDGDCGRSTANKLHGIFNFYPVSFPRFIFRIAELRQ